MKYYFDKTGLSRLWTKIKALVNVVNKKTIKYIEGNGTTAGAWTGTCEDITEYYDGLTIAYRTNIAGVSGGTTLNINGLGAVAVRRNTSAVTTHYPVNTVILLTYTTISGTGYWVCADYDGDTKVTQSAVITTDGNFPLLLGYSTTTTAVTNAVKKAASLLFNPGKGILQVGSSKMQTNGYITGTWLQAAADTHSSAKLNKVAVMDESGWIYTRTLDEIRSDLGRITAKNVGIVSSAWVSDNTFADFPYKATISIAGVTANHACTTMVPDHTNADLQYLFGPYVNTGAGTLEVWANSKPTAAITIELMIFELTG